MGALNGKDDKRNTAGHHISVLFTTVASQAKAFPTYESFPNPKSPLQQRLQPTDTQT